ncbi:putative Zinc finger, PHD-type, Zinc finger, FYVE/PHD-type, Zinc finger, RING/FYVE/PHD-type [Plasmopara halstedii]
MSFYFCADIYTRHKLHMSSKKTGSAHALTAALGTALAAIDSLEEVTSTSKFNLATDVKMQNVEDERLRRDHDTAADAQLAAPINPSDALKSVKMEESGIVDQYVRCSECKLNHSSSLGDKLRVCGSCKLAIHTKCYADALPRGEKTIKSSLPNVSLHWNCDACRRGVDPRVIKCVYCGISGGDHAIKLVEKDNDDEFWKQIKQFDKEAAEPEDYGHVLCINWDPRRLAAHIVKESKIERVKKSPRKESAKEISTESLKKGNVAIENGGFDDTKTTFVEELEEAVPDINDMRDPVSPEKCCFCHSNSGVRIQCRRVHCGQFFHAMCAHKGNGHVELRTGPMLQFHAYCERHRTCTEDIGDLLAKLVTRPVRLLVGRDDMRRFATIAKHLQDYTSAGTILRDLSALMVGYCHKSLRTSKSDPPNYNVKHLQVVQFFLSHVPQLEKVYGLPPTPAKNLVDDKKLFRRLQRTFDPPRYVAKYPGPLSQQYTCDVCLDPFHERQHLFYCSEGDIPHVQHWRCTKRQISGRDRERSTSVAGNSSTKKKRSAVTVVQNGVRKEITLPKGLPSITDDVICGVCGALVDTRGLISSRKEAKHLEFDKKESKFMQNGCYINPKGQHGYSYGTGSTSSRKPPRPNDGKLYGSYSSSQPVLTPPKMERINVQRTIRWLACVANIIRQAGIPARTGSDSTASTVASTAVDVVSASKPAISGSATDVVAAPSAVNDTIQSTVNAETEATLTAPETAAHRGSATADATATLLPVKLESKSDFVNEPEAEEALKPVMTPTSSTRSSILKESSLVTPAMQALFNEAIRLVQPYDAYALNKLETAHDFLVHRSGPGVAVLRMLTHEYTRFVYIKHTRAVEKARNEKRKRAEHEAQEHREKERKRMNLEAERALKKQMLAMRNKQRQHLKATSSK